MDRHQHQLYLNDLARRAEEKHAARLATDATCPYQWWHTFEDREVLIRCTKPAGHDGKHEHEAAE